MENFTEGSGNPGERVVYLVGQKTLLDCRTGVNGFNIHVYGWRASVVLRGEGPMRTSGMRYPGHNFIVVHASSRKWTNVIADYGTALRPLSFSRVGPTHYVKEKKRKGKMHPNTATEQNPPSTEMVITGRKWIDTLLCPFSWGRDNVFVEWKWFCGTLGKSFIGFYAAHGFPEEPDS